MNPWPAISLAVVEMLEKCLPSLLAWSDPWSFRPAPPKSPYLHQRLLPLSCSGLVLSPLLYPTGSLSPVPDLYSQISNSPGSQAGDPPLQGLFQVPSARQLTLPCQHESSPFHPPLSNEFPLTLSPSLLGQNPEAPPTPSYSSG